jgi:hypothetical protein
MVIKVVVCWCFPFLFLHFNKSKLPLDSPCVWKLPLSILRFYKIVTTSENYPVVLSKLQEEGLKFETDNGYELLPLNPIEVHCLPFLLSNLLFAQIASLGLGCSCTWTWLNWRQSLEITVWQIILLPIVEDSQDNCVNKWQMKSQRQDDSFKYANSS